MVSTMVSFRGEWISSIHSISSVDSMSRQEPEAEAAEPDEEPEVEAAEVPEAEAEKSRGEFRGRGACGFRERGAFRFEFRTL